MKPGSASHKTSHARASQTSFERAWAALTPDVSAWHPQARAAAQHLERQDFDAARPILRGHLSAHPHDPHGLYLGAELARQIGNRNEAEYLFSQCVTHAPEFHAARFHQANMLLETGKPDAALVRAGELLAGDPHNPVFVALKAMALELLDDFPQAAQSWRDVLDAGAPADYWVRYAHVLRALGRSDEAVAACREAIARDAGYGLAWWALAALTSFRFTDDDIAEMETLATRPDLQPHNRVPLLFTLGKAYADRAQYEKSFAYYARGNALKRLSVQHDPASMTAHVARSQAVLTDGFFRERAGYGASSRAPIFLVGMLRSGSTLVEQILASHSQVEGTRELFIVGALAREVTALTGSPQPYPDVLAQLTEENARTLGERYLDIAAPHRKTGRPNFIDKMGNNFAHIGLIHLMLPNAKIIDVRRHPMACGFSNFIQLYANGQDQTYRLSDIGQHYRDYVRLMAHFDRVLPGRVHRIFYEQLVAEPEKEIRRLLDYLELPFEQSCLEFHRNVRAVSTISSEQVRRPLHAEAVEHWRHYEPWLGPLKNALGAVADTYPDVPPLA